MMAVGMVPAAEPAGIAAGAVVLVVLAATVGAVGTEAEPTAATVDVAVTVVRVTQVRIRRR